MTSRVARLSILDSYGVRWTRESFARDLLQNFFDSTADFRAISIAVTAGEAGAGSDAGGTLGTVEIRGPETFDIELLAYIGATTKTSGRTVGGFGEGFKICALLGARDFGLTITAGSGAHEIEVFFDPVPLGRELCYRVTTREEDPLAGSYVRLAGCDAATLAAFRAAPQMFRHPDNPKLGEPIVVDDAQGVGVYAVGGGRDGEIYYRRQLRGRTRFYAGGAERPLTLAHDGIIDALEGDRDRRDVAGQPVAEAVGLKLSPDALGAVIAHLMPCWKLGNEVLSGLLLAAVARGLRYTWPERWLARSAKRPGLVELAERQGYQIALATFATLGMPTPDEHYTGLETRAPTPLERGRFAVVRDLYGELVGQPARTTRFEVFAAKGAAVLGQHLGDKVILAAEPLEAGFDAVSGTILHELAHETGGEEDIRFLRRLTLLLGEALRSPEKIRSARLRYANAQPAEEPPPDGSAASAAYNPEHDQGIDDTEGVVVTVLVPPAFPPTEALMTTLRAAAAEAGIGIWVTAASIDGAVGAVTWKAPGLPTVMVSGADVEPPAPGDAALGYRLRTYGAEGTRLCPDPEAIKAALRRAKALKQTGQAGLALHMGIVDGHRERVQAALGVTLPAPPARRKGSRREERDALVRAWLQGRIMESYPSGLDGVWVHGRLAAVEAWIARARPDRRSATTVYVELLGRLQGVVGFVEGLRAADPDFDDADALEREAMHAAMGAAVAAFAQEEGDAAANGARAEAAFRAVRAGTTRVLDLPVAQEAKLPVLAHALAGAGIGKGTYPPEGSFDGEAFARALAAAEAEALRLQRVIDEEGGFMLEHVVTTALDKLLGDTPAARNRAMWEEQRRTSLIIRAAYDNALAASGDPIAAARRCMDEAARLRPEARP